MAPDTRRRPPPPRPALSPPPPPSRSFGIYYFETARPACGSGPLYLTAATCGLGGLVSLTNRIGAGQLAFKVQRAIGTPVTAPLYGSLLEMTSQPRSEVPGCPAALGVSSLSIQFGRNPPCGMWLPHIKTLSGFGVEQWVLEDAGGGLVRIRNKARPPTCPRYLGIGAACGSGPAVRLYAANATDSITTWRMHRLR